MKFDKIWEVNKQHLKNFIAQKIPQPEVPDMLQNISIELFNSLEKGVEIKNTKNWLFQVSRNLIVDYYKQKSKSNNSVSNYCNISDDFEPCICDIMEQIIQSVVPERYGKPLILSDLYNIPQKEIAKQLNINYENTKSRIQRGRKKLKEAFHHSIEFVYNSKGAIVGGRLKPNNNLPADLVQTVKILQLED